MSNSAKLKLTQSQSPPVVLARARLKESAEFGQDEDKDPDAPPPGDDLNPDTESKLEEPPSMDPEEGDDPEAFDEDDENFTIEDVVKCFLRANPSPTDEQVHAFAALVNLEYEEFEAIIFKKFGEVVRQATNIAPSEEDNEELQTDGVEDNDLDVDEDDEEPDGDLEADEELDVQDDIDMFVVAYILYNPEPSDEQIHQLAFVVDITKEQMEQRIYRMLGTFLQMSDETTHGEDDDIDDDSEQDIEEDEDEQDGADEESDDDSSEDDDTATDD